MLKNGDSRNLPLQNKKKKSVVFYARYGGHSGRERVAASMEDLRTRGL